MPRSGANDEKVSVIIVNWNGEHYLEECLRSVLNQTYTNREIILIDNASADKSLQLVERHFPEVIVMRNRENVGFAAANNIGIRRASGKYIATLNNDAMPEVDWLAELVGAMDDEEVGMVASLMIFYHRPDVINSTGISLDKAAIAWDRLGGQSVDCSQTGKTEIFGPCAGAALYRKEMLDDVGLFDETFFMYLEDVDLAWRARLRGWRCIYIPTARVHHIHSASSRDGSALKSYLLGRNKVWVTVKNYPAPEFYFYLPIILFYDLISLPYAPLLRRNIASLLGHIDGFKGLGAVWRKRREIQSERIVPSKTLSRLMDGLVSPLTLYRRYRRLDQLTLSKLRELSDRIVP